MANTTKNGGRPDISAKSTGANDTAAKWPDLAGRLSVGEHTGAPIHELPIRVYFEDTDFTGLVYHASYVRWCERGRSDFLRLGGNDHKDLMTPRGGAEPCGFVVRRMALEFLKPARIDDVLAVKTTVHELNAASLSLDQTIWRDGEKLFEARVLVVLVSASGRPQRLSKAIGQLFGG